MTNSQYGQQLRGLNARILDCGDYILIGWQGSRFLTSFPFHQPIELSIAAALGTCVRHNLIGMRFAVEPGRANATAVEWVCHDRDYDIDKLSPNHRSKIRRGLKRCRIEPLEPEQVYKHGFQAYKDTRVRHGSWEGDEAGRRSFEMSCENWTGRPDNLLWGAWVDDKLAAFVHGMLINDRLYSPFLRSCSGLLSAYPNDALLHSLLCWALREKGVSAVSYGLQSLLELQGLDSFKAGLGFTPDRVPVRVVFHPVVAWWINRYTARPLAAVLSKLKFLPGGRMAAGLLRTYHRAAPKAPAVTPNDAPEATGTDGNP